MSALKALSAAALLAATGLAHAELRNVTVTVENLAPASGIAFAPLHVGFGNGSFDAFNLGATPGAAIISVAEGGAGVAWHAQFAAANPTAVRGTVGGLLLAGGTASLSFLVDTDAQGMFSYAAMVVPSNDFFIGNDSALALFDGSGKLTTGSITLKARHIWDAGSEVFDPAAAAFVGNNNLRAEQGSVVALNFGELAGFNGLATGAGYSFHSGLSADTDIYRISFSAQPVPEPATMAMLLAGLATIGRVARRRAPR